MWSYVSLALCDPFGFHCPAVCLNDAYCVLTPINACADVSLQQSQGGSVPVSAAPRDRSAKRSGNMNARSRLLSLWEKPTEQGDPFRSLHSEIDRVFDEFSHGMMRPIGESGGKAHKIRSGT
jgi:hypothetical protein